MKGNSKSTYPSGLLQRSNFVLNPSRTKPHPKPTSFFPHPQPFKRQNLQAPISYNQLSLSLSLSLCENSLWDISLSLCKRRRRGNFDFFLFFFFLYKAHFFVHKISAFLQIFLLGFLESWNSVSVSLCVLKPRKE